MSTVSCPFCAEDILEQAKKCKHCGEFVDSSGLSHSNAIQTTQETSKKLKSHYLFSVIIILIGVIILFTVGKNSKTIPVLICTIGLGWYFVTRFRIWWNHK